MSRAGSASPAPEVSIPSIADEFQAQPSILHSFRTSPEWSELESVDAPVFVGAGDSYAAGLCASLLAGPRVAALDPYSLSESVEWAKGRRVYIVSVSGQTSSNVELARALRGVASKTTAITCNLASRLAAEADTSVRLPFTPRPRSPGIASFVLSLSAVLKVAGFHQGLDFQRLLSRASAASTAIEMAGPRAVTHLTGNNELYGASLYGAAKVYEMVGGRAQASLLEEFSHTTLFSLAASDRVNIFQPAGQRKGAILFDRLEDGGFRASLLPLEGSRLERLYTAVFALQASAIRTAKSRGFRAPYFLSAREKLSISDELIY